MLFSRDWLAQYVEIDDFRDLCERLTAAGLAVEETGSKGDDVWLDVDVTTNRPDCMNHLGLAREAAVLTGRNLRPPAVEVAESPQAAADVVEITIEDFDRCPRYVGMVIEGVEVGPSPQWLVDRLAAIDQRSINNVVDVTNYVLWESGQPLHAFDLDRLGGAEIRVRPARDGEELETLDGERRTLDPEVLVIADAERAVALAGIMGGLDSEVTGATTRVLLESAHFDPAAVRRGAKKLALHTDASHRFERGADPEGCLWAARRAAALIAEVAGGEVRAGAVDVRRQRSDWPVRVDLEHDKLNRFAGIEIDAAEVESTLTGLGFEIEAASAGGAWRVTVPPWRFYDFDNAYPADLYEEVLRIHGFDAVPATLPQLAGADAPESAGHARQRRIRDRLAAIGFAEAINFAFHDEDVDRAYPNLVGDRDPLRLANPLSDRYAVMRRSLLPNLVRSALYNQRRGAQAVRLFELAHVFCDDGEGGSHEQETLALAMGGRLGTPWERQAELDFYDLKGSVESVGLDLGLELKLRPATRPRLVEGASADVLLDGRTVGYVGQVAEPDSVYPLFVAELAVDELSSTEQSKKTRPPSKYPGIAIDTTLTHSLQVTWDELAGIVAGFGVDDLVDFGLKDRYRGAGVPEGAVNSTIYFLYNSDQRSLTQEEVNERHALLARELEDRFGLAG